VALAVASVGLAAAPLVPVERHHRLHAPPPPVTTLPSSLAVDESEYTLRPSQIVLAAGEVKINVYNRGMDDHDLTLVDAHGQVQSVPLGSGADAVLEADVAAGPVRLYCSLFAGTPDSHIGKGMVFDLTAH
jgi:hypothetical protein